MSRTRVLWAASIVAGVLIACSGDDSTVNPNNPADSGTDATVSDGSSGGTDSAPLPDVGLLDTGSGGGPIACGGQGTTCDSKTQDCCLENPPVCAPKGTCAGGYLSCSGTSSCPTGDVCCATVERGDGGGAGDGGGDGGGGATVTATCAAAACGKGELQLCTDNNDCKIAGEECRRGPGGLKGCRKIQDGGAGDGGGDVSDGGDSG